MMIKGSIKPPPGLKRNRFKQSFAMLTLLLSMLVSGCSQETENPQSTAAAGQTTVLSGKGLFSLTLQTESRNPAPINQFHNWLIGIRDQDGKPVYPAAFSVTGGMPSHGHGLPTQPKVTQYLGDGKYLLEGLKFNMAGEWQLKFHILSGEQQDSAETVIHVHY